MASRKPTHPPQPKVVVKGIIRYKENSIIRWLADEGLLDLNKIAIMNFHREDRVQLAQLLGYSVDSFANLSYVKETDI